LDISLVLCLADLAEEDVLEGSTMQPAKLSGLIGPKPSQPTSVDAEEKVKTTSSLAKP
jgi:hypothetical protein